MTWLSYILGGFLFGIWRAAYLDPVAIDLAARGIARQDLPAVLSALLGAPPATVGLVTALAVLEIEPAGMMPGLANVEPGSRRMI